MAEKEREKVLDFFKHFFYPRKQAWDAGGYPSISRVIACVKEK